jgi:hypothetical protein
LPSFWQPNINLNHHQYRIHSHRVFVGLAFIANPTFFGIRWVAKEPQPNLRRWYRFKNETTKQAK